MFYVQRTTDYFGYLFNVLGGLLFFQMILKLVCLFFVAHLIGGFFRTLLSDFRKLSILVGRGLRSGKHEIDCKHFSLHK